MAQRFKTPITIEDATSAASQAVAAKVNGDTQSRVNIDAGGKITWGDGSSAGDTNLYRSAADALKTDDTLEAAAGIITSTSSGAPTATISDGAIAVDTTNDKLYFRSGSTWQVVTGGGATNSDTAPSSPSDGDLWFESDTGGFYVYYDSQWIDIGGTSVANVAASSAAPSSPAVGDMWLDTDTLQTFVYYDDGNTQQWVEIGVTGTVNAIEDADGNTKIQVEESANENKIRFDTDGTERMIIDDSGNVGINDTTPSYTLDVNGDINSQTDVLVGGSSLPRGHIGDHFVSNYTLTTSYTEVVRVNFTSPASNRWIRYDFRGILDNVAAGGRIITIRFQHSLDGGSTWSTEDYNWWLTYDANDVRSLTQWRFFGTGGNTSLACRVLLAKSSGSTGDFYSNQLLVTDIGGY